MRRQWTYKFHGDEVRIYKSNCLNPEDCDCYVNDPDVKCVYTAKEVRQKIIEHYLGMADKFHHMSDGQFLRYFGYVEFPE